MADLEQTVRAMRDFNRFYTRTLGLLNERLTDSDFTLAEARVLFELGRRDAPVAGEIASALLLDPAYLARILRRFRETGLVVIRTDEADRRRKVLALGDAGRSALDMLQARSEAQIAAMIAPLGADGRAQLLLAMSRVRALLETPDGEARPVRLRPHQAGDMGWVVQEEAKLYSEEYGWNSAFEALVARICADFLDAYRHGRDFCWIAERGGERVGAIFLVGQDNEVARLRLLHVCRTARGQGIGRMLVERCVAQARDCGYYRLVLWTNSVLVAARRLYEQAGFQLVGEEPHESFGKQLVSQHWELDLRGRDC
jgi:DNA-binding MarR family transcriptional regulator/GNAT superfamily N-acetyltransferase